MTSALHAKYVIEQWQDAYRKANMREAPNATYRAGWITFSGEFNGKRRVAEVERMTQRIRDRMANV